MLNFLKNGLPASGINRGKSNAVSGFRQRVTCQQNAGFLHFLRGACGNTLKRTCFGRRKNLRHTTNADYCLNNMLKPSRNNIVPRSAVDCRNFFRVDTSGKASRAGAQLHRGRAFLTFIAGVDGRRRNRAGTASRLLPLSIIRAISRNSLPAGGK